VAEHDELHVVELVRPGGRVAQDHLRKGRLRIAAARSRNEQQARDRVVRDARTDAGEIHHRLNAEVEQRGLGPDARPHEDGRRADRAGCEGDAPPEDPFSLCTGLDFYPDGPVVLDEDAADEAVRPDGEVEPLTGGQQVGDRGRKPQAVSPVLREGADAGCLWMVMVGDLGEAEASADLEEGALRRNELVSAPAADRDRATAPVELIGPCSVVLQATKVRQHLRPAPGIVAQRRPLVVIRRHAAQGNRGIDRGGAADHPATRIGNGPAGHGLGGQPPVVLAQRHPPTVLKIVRDQLEGCEVRTRVHQ
jgi:hypothetical protein